MLSELARYEDITVGSISFGLLPGEGIPARFYNNAAKTAVALRSAYRLIKDKAYCIFRLPTLGDDVPEQASLPALCYLQEPDRHRYPRYP